MDAPDARPNSRAEHPLGDRETDRAAWRLTGFDPFSDDYHPAFTGNGFFAARVPAAGQGYSRRKVETQFPVAGLFGFDGRFQVRAGAPAWTGLTLAEASGSFDDVFAESATGAARVDDYRQVLDLATGVIETSARWTAASGAVFGVTYAVFTDRVVDERGVVALTVTPAQSGEFTVTDVLDSRAATLTSSRTAHPEVAPDAIGLDTRLAGTGLALSVVSTLVGPGERTSEASDGVDDAAPVARQTLRIEGEAGVPVTVVKYVGIAVDDEGDAERAAARAAEVSRAATDAGVAAIGAGNDAAWALLWRGDIRVGGDDLLQRQIRASRFFLLASCTAARPWSLSPAGLSSDGYGGHVFWDTETWMWPSLLLQNPDIAAAVLQYRADRADDAETAARALGDDGLRFPWEGALDGFEHTPAIEFGETELHIVSDIALAAWWYYLATGDLDWLAQIGARLIVGAADFWVGRAEADESGALHLRHITPPDEWAQAHDDSAYTNVSAAVVARLATRTAELLDRDVRPEWADLAARITVLHDAERNLTPEHADYTGQRIKQADVVMITYPWEFPQSEELIARNLDYYATKVTEHGGPSMTDAMHSIVSAQLGRAGDAWWYTRRSAQPFLREPFLQFAEERDGGAFTFVTGAGGFLQEFLYGYTGLRLREDGISLHPILPAELDELALTGLSYRGSRYDLTVDRHETTVALVSGPPLTVHAGGVAHTATTDASVRVSTRRSIDADAGRGRGRIVAAASAAAPAASHVPSRADDFTVASVEIIEDGSLTRFVATVVGEIDNAAAGEAMTSQLLHIYLRFSGEERGARAFLPGVDGETAAPWQLALLASGLRQGGPDGTGLYDHSGRFVADVELRVSQRRSILLSVPTAAFGGRRPAEAELAVVMIDDGARAPEIDQPHAAPTDARTVFVPAGVVTADASAPAPFFAL